MPKAAIMRQTGGSEVFQVGNIPEPRAPGPGQVLIRHTAIGLNFDDIKYRNGSYKTPNMPIILGTEAVGVVEAVGPDVKLEVGRRVAYCTAPSGAYCEKRLIHAKYLVGVPDEIPDQIAAAALAKGMTAHYLVCRVYRVAPNDTVLVHAAAGGTGQMICQWAKKRGAKVIGTVGSDEKILIARSAGCDYVINYTTTDFVKEVAKFTKNEGVPVVFDSVGKATFAKSLQCLKPLGLMVSIGESSGPVPGFNILNLAARNIFLTRPTLAFYKQGHMEYILTAIEVFKMIQEGHLRINIDKTYRLSQIAQAHQDMEARNTRGPCIIIP